MKKSFRVSLWISAVAVMVLNAPAVEQRGQMQSRYRVAWSTFLGGAQWDQAREVIPYADGSVLVGAQSASSGMPVTEGVVQPKYAGDDPNLGAGGVYGGDCYLAHISADGRRLIAATYFGGSRQERNTYGMGIDRAGNIVIASATRSPDLPTNVRGFQPKYGGGPSDWLVAKIAPDLKKILWCTYIGGEGDDFPRGGLVIDPQDNVIVVGVTASKDFPVTPRSYQPHHRGTRDSAIVKLRADGTGLLFSTMLGGLGETDTAMGARLDSRGDIYVAGHTKSESFPVTEGASQAKFGGESDVYVSKLSGDGERLLYSTYLGGARNEFAEHQPFLTDDGLFLVTGVTSSPNFPTTDEAFQRTLKGPTDGFVTAVSADGRRFAFSTYLGGSGGDFFLMPIATREGIILVGTTGSRDFPVTPDALQKQYGGGEGDGALVILSRDGSKIIYATYLGGGGGDLVRGVALGAKGELYLVGSTSSSNFPVTSGAVQAKIGKKGDAFVMKLVP